ncbi:MAG: hypothetical protein ACJAYU_004467 [Bradymonadia bacterium]|jgi:hypothetical protein
MALTAAERGNTAELVQRLRDEHAMLEEQLESYSRRVYLSAREQMERKRLKKIKLVTKDRLHSLESPV